MTKLEHTTISVHDATCHGPGPGLNPGPNPAKEALFERVFDTVRLAQCIAENKMLRDSLEECVARLQEYSEAEKVLLRESGHQKSSHQEPGHQKSGDGWTGPGEFAYGVVDRARDVLGTTNHAEAES